MISRYRRWSGKASGSEGKVGWEGDELADFWQWLLKQLLLLHGDSDQGRWKQPGSTGSTAPAAHTHTRRQQKETEKHADTVSHECAGLDPGTSR